MTAGSVVVVQLTVFNLCCNRRVQYGKHLCLSALSFSKMHTFPNHGVSLNSREHDNFEINPRAVGPKARQRVTGNKYYRLMGPE